MCNSIIECLEISSREEVTRIKMYFILTLLQYRVYYSFMCLCSSIKSGNTLSQKNNMHGCRPPLLLLKSKMKEFSLVVTIASYSGSFSPPINCSLTMTSLSSLPIPQLLPLASIEQRERSRRNNRKLAQSTIQTRLLE